MTAQPDLIASLRELHRQIAKQLMFVSVEIQRCDTIAARTQLSLQVARLADEMARVIDYEEKETT